jgi:hypothetical protein
MSGAVLPNDLHTKRSKFDLSSLLHQSLGLVLDRPRRHPVSWGREAHPVLVKPDGAFSEKLRGIIGLDVPPARRCYRYTDRMAEPRVSLTSKPPRATLSDLKLSRPLPEWSTYQVSTPPVKRSTRRVPSRSTPPVPSWSTRPAPSWSTRPVLSLFQSIVEDAVHASPFVLDRTNYRSLDRLHNFLSNFGRNPETHDE